MTDRVHSEGLTPEPLPKVCPLQGPQGQGRQTALREGVAQQGLSADLSEWSGVIFSKWYFWSWMTQTRAVDFSLKC